MTKAFTTHEYVAMINLSLLSYFEPGSAESDGAEKMTEAMRYSIENGGKRIRPMLTLEFCRLCGGEPASAMGFACAVEMIHSYSLIHDDLPCMDDDNMRRGKPSSHIKFGEANALLAGDSLLTLAFETALGAELNSDKLVRGAAILARAAGFAGMIAGQVMDLANEDAEISAERLRQTDALKTGELIKAACLLGCAAAGATAEQTAAAERYAENLGLAFQVVDDILDVTSDEATLGKPIGSDAEQNKNTYVSLLGLDGAKKSAEALTKAAVDALEIFGSDAAFLVSLSENLLSRSC